MHIHLGFMHLLSIFIGVNILIGTLWRVLAFKLAASENAVAEDIGQAMAFIY